MRDDNFIVFITCISVVLGMLLGFLTTNSHYQTEAIEKGFAEYNQVTGEWQWKEPTKEPELEYKCPCGKSFDSPIDLYKHMEECYTVKAMLKIKEK